MARSLFRFGFWVLLEGLGAWLIIWGDNLIVGRFLGVHDLGVYRTGWSLVTIIFGLVLNPFLPVLYPTFSRMQDDLPVLKNTFHRVNRVIFALALPMGTGLLLVGSEAVTLLFGEKWQGLGFVISVLGLTYSISWLVSLNTEVYRAMGKPNVNSILMYVHILYYLPCFYIAAQYGLETFTITRLSVAIIAIPIQTYFCVKLLKVPPFYLWHQAKPMMFATLSMAAGVSILKWIIMPLIHICHISLSLAILVGVGCIIYVVCLYCIDRHFFRQTFATIRKAALT